MNFHGSKSVSALAYSQNPILANFLATRGRRVTGPWFQPLWARYNERQARDTLIVTMHSKQRKVLVAGTALVALMLLFPPWDYFDPDSSARSNAGYHFFLTPPPPRPAKEIFGQPRFPHNVPVKLSDLTLIIQLLIVIPTTLGLAFLLEARRYVITSIIGIMFLLVPVSIVAFILWVVISEWLR
jgi:hypothetical protein